MSGWKSDTRRVLLMVQPDVRDQLATALRASGYDIVERTDPTRALDELKKEAIPPHTVILDWSLPGATGSEILRNFASNPRYLRSHMIVLSDSSKDGIPSLCVSAILPKPISADLVLRTVEALEKR